MIAATLNPDVMPWQIALPVAGLLWAYLIAGWIRWRR